MRLTRRPIVAGLAITVVLAPLACAPIRESIAWHADDYVCREVWEGNLTILKVLVPLGYDLNKRRTGCEDEPIRSAAYSGKPDSVAWLLAHGADPELDDKWGTTALGIAARDGNREIVEILLEAGADPMKQGEYGTPILTAARHCHADVVRLLQSKGAALPTGFTADPECR